MNNHFNKVNVVIALGFAAAIHLLARAIMGMPEQLKKLHQSLKESSED